MNTSTPTTPRNNGDTAVNAASGFSLWRQLKDKRICYFALPLIVMATIAEFVILATGWKYQQTVCVPNGMGVTFFGIGPIGATILAVEALKLPLAIWTASRIGWQKAFMLLVGLPLICVLTFQLVKDMAVYEMEVAMRPASEMLEKASAEEIRINQLNGELTAIEAKKIEREQKLQELADKQAKTKADLDDALKRNDATRQDAISLTDYQSKELSTVEARQAAIIKQFNEDSEKLTKVIADLHARREVEVARSAKWNAEEARIENEYKGKMKEYANLKAAYEKDLAEYNAANVLRRQLMREPVNPGVPPVRESNTILKSAELADIDAEIKAKEAEFLAVSNKRRERVAQVDADARRLREDFDRRSSSKREETDRKREELIAAHAVLAAQLSAEEKQINQEYQAAAQRTDGIRADIDEHHKQAGSYYESREAAIKGTQVHRIATTVEIVRGLLMGKRPVSITATAKERGDLYTDQISMVRVWVYPVLAFIVAFLPTLMVEIGFSTLFHPERQRPAYRLGFFGRRLHWLYTRAGRLKILRAERMAREASGRFAAREHELASVKTEMARKLAEKEVELQARDEAWAAKHAGLMESLNEAAAENDALRDLQKAEIERQIQQRQNAWSERLSQLNKEWDEQRAASEAERAALIQEHHKKQLAVAEDCKSQVIEARREAAKAELAAKESSAKLTQELKEAGEAREIAEARLKHQADSFALQLSHAREQGGREVEKAVRQERQRLERQQAELEKALRHRDEDFEHRLKQREQELVFAFDMRMAEEKTKAEDEARRREADVERQLEARAREVDARWNLESQEQEETFQIRLKQQELQLQAQSEARLRDAQIQADEELRRQESEFKRQIEAQSREADANLRGELQKKDLEFHARIKQREQELASRAAARETELQTQWAADLRVREEEWEQQTASRLQAAAAHMGHEAQHKEEDLQSKIRQREQQLQSQFDARLAQLKTEWDQDVLEREQEWERNAEARARDTESRLMAEMQQREDAFQAKFRHRDQQWQGKLDAARADMQAQAEQESRHREMESANTQARALRELEDRLRREMKEKLEAEQREAQEHEQELVAQLNMHAEACRSVEKERDAARHSAVEGMRQVQELKKKLTDVSSLLSGWKSGSGNGNGNGNGHGNGEDNGESVLVART